MCAEPVLLVGFQDMYSNVFKVLMQHRSIVHMEQVEWAMDEPLGVMLPDLHGKAVPAKYKRLPLDTEVLPITESELAPTHTPTEGGMLEGACTKGAPRLPMVGPWTKPSTRCRRMPRACPSHIAARTSTATSSLDRFELS